MRVERSLVAIAAALCSAVALPAGASSATVTVVLSSDARVRDLNLAWRGQDKPTNVLSFQSPAVAAMGRRRRGEAEAGPMFLGDVVLAQETLAREAAAGGIAGHDHFCHLVVHGVLHLLGYDHESEAEAVVMEALEVRILADLGIADPYAGSDPAQRPVPVAKATRRK